MLFHRTVSKDCHHGTGNEKPLEGTQKALWALQGPSKGFMKPFKRPLGTPFLGGKRRATLGKRDKQCLVQIIPARIYAVSQDVVDRQAHLLDSNAMAFGCWTQRQR